MSSVDQAASAELLTPTQPRFGAGGVVWLIVVIALLSVLATFLSLIGLTPYTPSNTVLAVLMAINAIAVLLLSAFVARQLWVIIQARRRGRAGARLHVRIIGLFAVIAAVPEIGRAHV